MLLSLVLLCAAASLGGCTPVEGGKEERRERREEKKGGKEGEQEGRGEKWGS